MADSPTSRSLDKLRAEGWLVAVAEKWNPFANVRQDLFGFVDLLAIRDGETLAVQVTTAENVSARLAKLRSLPAVQRWIACPTRKVVVHGWALQGTEKSNRKTWQCREVEFTTDMARG